MKGFFQRPTILLAWILALGLATTAFAEPPTMPRPAEVATTVVTKPEADRETPHFSFTGDDDDEATMQLTKFLQQHDLEVMGRSGNVIAVARDGFLVGLQPAMTNTSLDRLVATFAFNLRDGVEDETVHAIARKLNDQTGGIQYSVASGKLLCQVLITFVDQLSLTEIEMAIDYLKGLQLATLFTAPELVNLLQR